jgi:hypothetical protein
MGEARDLYRVLLGKLEGKVRWVGHIKVDLQEVGCGGMD